MDRVLNTGLGVKKIRHHGAVEESSLAGQHPKPYPPAVQHAVEVRAIVKRYGELVAVGGIDFAARAGTCLGLLGPNGAGKTTTIEILEGLQRPDAGEVRVLGRRWDREGHEIRERIGVQLQETELQAKLTVFETLRMFRSFYREGRDVDEVVARVGLGEKRDGRVGELSGGQKQRLALGCALVNRPEVLFLDEPTTGLDPQARRRVWEIVEEFKAGGGAVILTTHYMEEAERLADELVIVDHGKVISAGTPRAIVAGLEAESIVSLRPRDGAELTAEELGALDGVREARRGGECWTLSVVDTKRAILALLEHLRARGVEVDDLDTHRPTLEDVFVSITGKTLRDA